MATKKTGNYTPRDLAMCIAALEKIAVWDDGRGGPPLEYDGQLDEPGAALTARAALIKIGYRTPEGAKA